MKQSNIKPSPIWKYGELHNPRSFDNGDRASYGHGLTRLIKVVLIDNDPVKVTCIIGKPSKYKGTRQFIS